MKLVIYIAANGDRIVPDFVYDPESKTSRKNFADAVQDVLCFEDVIPETIDFEDWMKHPAYIATINGDWKFLKSMLAKIGYKICSIPVL